MTTVNSTGEATPASTPAGPATDVVIFGASGDLSNRKILPALGRLSAKRDIRVVGVGRRAMSREQFCELVARSSASQPSARAPDGYSSTTPMETATGA
jgi:glucose-6-phosphate 1-dehydrogenase